MDTVMVHGPIPKLFAIIGKSIIFLALDLPEEIVHWSTATIPISATKQ